MMYTFGALWFEIQTSNSEVIDQPTTGGGAKLYDPNTKYKRGVAALEIGGPVPLS